MEIRISGIDAVVRELRGIAKRIEDELDNGCDEAGKYLVEKIQECIDEGNFTPLAQSTIDWETKMGSPYASDILKYTLDMYDSFYYQKSAKTRKHVVWVLSDSPYLKYHVYGWGVPMRDPMRETVKAHEKDVHDIIRKAVHDAVEGR